MACWTGPLFEPPSPVHVRIRYPPRSCRSRQSKTATKQSGGIVTIVREVNRGLRSLRRARNDSWTPALRRISGHLYSQIFVGRHVNRHMSQKHRYANTLIKLPGALFPRCQRLFPQIRFSRQPLAPAPRQLQRRTLAIITNVCKKHALRHLSNDDYLMSTAGVCQHI